MLSVKINVKKVDFNREILLVHHITDDVTGQAVPICGAKVDSLVGGCDEEYILENLGKPGFDYFKNDDEMCSRCAKAHLAPGTDEKKSQRRLRRWNQKKEREAQKKNFETQIVSNFLAQCPKCSGKLTPQDEYGYSSMTSACTNCNLQWDFFVSVKHSGTFVVWAHDEFREYDGKLEGRINQESPAWIWREPFVSKKDRTVHRPFRIPKLG